MKKYQASFGRTLQVEFCSVSEKNTSHFGLVVSASNSWLLGSML